MQKRLLSLLISHYLLLFDLFDSGKTSISKLSSKKFFNVLASLNNIKKNTQQVFYL